MVQAILCSLTGSNWPTLMVWIVLESVDVDCTGLGPATHIRACTYVYSQVCAQQQCAVAVGGKGPEYQNVTVCAQVV